MHSFKTTLAGVALAVSLSPAWADDQSIDLSSGWASFGNTMPLLDGGDDVITFTGLAAGMYDFSVAVQGQYITDLGGSINGQALSAMDIGGSGVFRLAYLEWQGDGPLVLTITGSSISDMDLASYAVTMSATPVPEPTTWALMAGGLGLFGFLGMRNRRRD